jgi:heme/copper-type cytochrome/quinol oxidase subunit 2
MTLSALALMLIVWTLVIGMATYCYTKMLRSGRRLDDDRSAEQAYGDSHET